MMGAGCKPAVRQTKCLRYGCGRQPGGVACPMGGKRFPGGGKRARVEYSFAPWLDLELH
jgi:hypothetical protein